MVRISLKTLALCCLALLFSVSLFNGYVPAGEKKQAVQVNCDIQHKACTQALNGGSVTLDVFPKPVKAMEALTFLVTLSGLNPPLPPVINLGMPGMTMGPNQVMLTTAGLNAYQGEGVIVRCPSGRTLWRATVRVPGAGAVDFVFDVVY